MSKGFKKSEERLQVSVQHQAEEAQSDQDGAEKERKSHAQKHAHRALTFFGGFLRWENVRRGLLPQSGTKELEVGRKPEADLPARLPEQIDPRADDQ